MLDGIDSTHVVVYRSHVKQGEKIQQCVASGRTLTQGASVSGTTEA